MWVTGIRLQSHEHKKFSNVITTTCQCIWQNCILCKVANSASGEDGIESRIMLKSQPVLSVLFRESLQKVYKRVSIN